MRTHTRPFCTISYSDGGEDADYCFVHTDAMKSGRYVSKFRGEITASLIWQKTEAVGSFEMSIISAKLYGITSR